VSDPKIKLDVNRKQAREIKKLVDNDQVVKLDINPKKIKESSEWEKIKKLARKPPKEEQR